MDHRRMRMRTDIARRSPLFPPSFFMLLVITPNGLSKTSIQPTLQASNLLERVAFATSPGAVDSMAIPKGGG